MSFGSKTTKTNQKFDSQTDPWDETVPYLKGFLEKLGGVASAPPGATPDQKVAFDQLKANAQAGNPNVGAIEDLASDQFNTADRTGTVQQGYADLQRRLSSTADGANLNLDQNPMLQKMLTQVSDDVQNRVGAQFAAAGRDFSGAHQGAVAKGVTSAQLPMLMDFYAREQGRTDTAARDLFSGAGQTATTAANLDQVRDTLRSKGIDTTKAALEAKDQGSNTILALEQQLKTLPAQDLAQIASLLFPAAGLGQQTSGTQQGTSKTNGWSVNLADIGKMATAIGSMCDARMKTDVARIGAMADGTPLYRFRYLGSESFLIGPMAQEVAERTPDAVLPFGELLTVDVLKATARSEAIINGGTNGDA
jgi:hypothetical protein